MQFGILCDFGTGQATKTDEFSEKFQSGGGVTFNPKQLYCRFWAFMQGFKEHFSEKRSENSFILVFRPVPLQNCRHKSSSCVSQKEICISHLKTPAFIDEALAKKGSALI